MNNRPQLKISPKPLLKRFDTSDLAFCSVGKFYLQNLSDNRRKSDYLDMNLKALPLGTLMPSDSMVAEPLTQDALYKQVALEYGPALARLANAYDVNAEQQQDLLQDIHLAIWQSFSGFNGQCSIRTWMYRVAHNTAATHALRGRRRQSSKLVSVEELDEVPHEHDSERLVDEAAVLQRLSKLIQQLKALDRDVILLYLEGIEAAEIGDIVGLSPSNVAQKVHRIKKLLEHRFQTGDFYDVQSK
jgi:RNA polymerase sigma-70 factor (ECF subfamily)